MAVLRINSSIDINIGYYGVEKTLNEILELKTAFSVS